MTGTDKEKAEQILEDAKVHGCDLIGVFYVDKPFGEVEGYAGSFVRQITEYPFFATNKRCYDSTDRKTGLMIYNRNYGYSESGYWNHAFEDEDAIESVGFRYDIYTIEEFKKKYCSFQREFEF